MSDKRFIRFSRFTLRGRRWFFRFQGDNSKTIFPSEAYNSAAARDRGIEVARTCADAPVFDENGVAPRPK